MNIFFLDVSPAVSAKAQTDKHVVKMILESAQLLSTAHRVLDGKMFISLSANNRRLKKWDHPTMDDILYKSTHVNHPSAVWVRESVENYNWLYEHFVALCEEYTKRFYKTHTTEKKLRSVLSRPPKNIPMVPMTPVRCAISDEQYIVQNNPVLSYRKYYIAEKLKTEKDTTRFYKVLQIP